MPSQASLKLQHMRKGHLLTRAHLKKLMDAGVGDRLPGVIPAWTNTTDPGVAAEMVDARQRAGALEVIAEFRAAFPEARLPAVDFQFVHTGVPNAFAAHVAKDDSYAIGLNHGVLDLLQTLFLAAVAARDKDSFDLFAFAAASLVGLYFVGDSGTEVEKIMTFLYKAYTSSGPALRDVVDGFGETAMRFVVAHELGHIAHAHFQQGKPPVAHLQAGSADAIDVSAFDHDQEFDADAWAYAALLRVAGTDVRRLTLAAAVPFLCFRMIAFTSRLHEPGSEIGQLLRKSHPPDAARAARLRELASKEVGRVPPTPALDLLVKVDDYVRTETDKHASSRR